MLKLGALSSDYKKELGKNSALTFERTARIPALALNGKSSLDLSEQTNPSVR